MNGPTNELEKERQAFFRDLKHLAPAQAKAAAKDAWFLSQGERERIEHRADALLTEWRTKAEKILERNYESITGIAERTQEEADAIVAELDSLIEESESGQVGLDDFSRRYQELEARLNRVQRNLDNARDSVGPLREKEEDPEGYWQQIQRRYPRIREGVMGRMNPGPDVGP